MKAVKLLALAVLLSGCLGSDAPSAESGSNAGSDLEPHHDEAAPKSEEQTGAAKQPGPAFDSPITLTGCSGFGANAMVTGPLGDFSSPDGWHPSPTKLAGYEFRAMSCDRASSPSGAMARNVTFAFEAHGNISDEGKQNWTGGYSGLVAPLAGAKSMDLGFLPQWTTGQVVDSSGARMVFAVGDSQGSGSFSSELGDYFLTSAVSEYDEPNPGNPFKLRVVIGAAEDAYVDYTETLTSSAFGVSCLIEATGAYGAAQFPSVAGQFPMTACVYFVDSTIELTTGQAG